MLAMYYHKREQMARLLQAITSAGPRMTNEQVRFLEEHLTPWSSKRVKSEQRLISKMKRSHLDKSVKISRHTLTKAERPMGRPRMVRIRPARNEESTPKR